MKKLVYSVLLISSFSFAQKVKEVGDFNKVTSFDQIDVILKESNENKVIVDGSGSDDVEIVNKNGELKIRMQLTKMLSGDNVSATVYYKKIDAIEANDRVTVRTTNGSIVSISGKAKNQEVIVNSGGIYEAEKLITNQTVITTNAGGDADIYATDLVDAKVRAGGIITIHGKPKQINQKIVAGGKIEEAR
jgi:Putative auto-transporter adhesin, head GIN domain